MRQRSRLLKKAGLLTVPVFLCSFVMVLATTLPCLAEVRWATGGVRLSNHQSYVIGTAPDGAGGALVTWSSPVADVIYAQRISGSGTLMWGSHGVVVCDSSWGGFRSAPKVVSDGAGGAIVAWNDNRPGPNTPYAYAQRISSSGITRWAFGGVLVFASDEPTGANPNLVTDGARGAVVTGVRNNGSDIDIIANRVVDPGTGVWGPSGYGVVIGGGAGNQNNQMMTSDRHGGAFVAWEDTRYDPTKDIYANWVTSTGDPQWGAAPPYDDGVAVCNASSTQTYVMVVSDASNGAVITWADGRRGPAFKDLYANRVNVSGAVQWNGTSGRALCLSGSVYFPRTIPDGAGGAIVTWQCGPAGSFDVYANRMSSSGVPQWHGTTGTPVCVAAGDNQWPHIATDGLGGALIAWQNNGHGEVIRAQRVDSSGSTRWASGGVLVCGAYHQKHEALIASDGIGGGIIVWGDERSGSGAFYPYAQRISNSIWYLAEGTTAWGFSTYITIQNPNASAVSAEVTYMPKGSSKITETVTLPASSQTTLTNDHLTEKMGGAFDFSTRVVCNEGKAIAVDRTMSWTGKGASSPEGHTSVGVTSPDDTWYLPEGSSAWGFETWLLIQNPNGTKATCKVTYMIENESPQEFTKEVPANSRESYSMASDIGNKDASIKVESDVPIIPERAMYKNSRREGHDSIGTTTPASDYYLAEGTTAWGFTTYVLVQNPNPGPCDVTITYMTPSGKKEQPAITLPGNSRKTIRVNDVPGMANTDFSTKVHGSKPIIAERAMYWGAGTSMGEACHDSIGLAAPHTTFYLPDGQTSDGRETWTLVQNPNASAVSVEVSYLKAGGGAVSFTSSIPANSRKTFNVADKVESGRASIMVTCTTAGKKIMVERAMYWNNRGAGTDTIGGSSD